jgi:tRNA(fMet)-specific endonuclease VapC
VADQVGAQVSSAYAVVDTMIASAMIVGTRRPSTATLLNRYDDHLRGVSVLLSFATVTELRFGALKGGMGPKRVAEIEDWIRKVAVVLPDNDLVNVCARLRYDCQKQGHGLKDKIHDSDRWIASTAIRYDVPLISDDGIFKDAPGLRLLQA